MLDTASTEKAGGGVCPSSIDSCSSRKETNWALCTSKETLWIHLNARGLRSRPIHPRPCLSGFKTKVSMGKVGVIAGVQVCVHTNVPMCRCMSVSMSVWDCLRHSECESGWGHVIEGQNRKHNLAE